MAASQQVPAATDNIMASCVTVFLLLVHSFLLQSFMNATCSVKLNFKKKCHDDTNKLACVKHYIVLSRAVLILISDINLITAKKTNIIYY